MVINTHHLPRAFDSVFEWLDVEVKVVHEPEIRGTAGGVAGARRQLGERTRAGLEWGHPGATRRVDRLLEGAALGSLCLAVVPRPLAEGTVGLDAAGHVVRLRGEFFGEEVSGGDYVGIAGIGPRTLANLPDKGCLIGDVAVARASTRRRDPDGAACPGAGAISAMWRATWRKTNAFSTSVGSTTG